MPIHFVIGRLLSGRIPVHQAWSTPAFTGTRFAGAAPTFLSHRSTRCITVPIRSMATSAYWMSCMVFPFSLAPHPPSWCIARPTASLVSSPRSDLHLSWPAMHLFPLIHSVTLDYSLSYIFLQTFHGSCHSKITRVPMGGSMPVLFCILTLPCTLSGIELACDKQWVEVSSNFFIEDRERQVWDRGFGDEYQLH